MVAANEKSSDGVDLIPRVYHNIQWVSNNWMLREAQTLQPDFETMEVSSLLGIPPILLNKFVERGSYGIVPSVRSGKGRGSRRRFSQDDLFGIALVWWLFESGLRTKTIQYVLNQICGRRLGSKASDAARIVVERNAELLIIRREPRKEVGTEYPKQRVLLTDAGRMAEQMKGLKTETLLVLPVGHLNARLNVDMQRLQSGERV